MKDGFFTKKETESKSRPDGKVYSCASCGLYKDAIHPKMKPFGNFKKGILNIGEAPGEAEDQKGKPWQGKTGRLLQKTYRELGIDLFEDCLNINACFCRPINEAGNNRTPTGYEIDCCRRKLLKVIDEYLPKVIVLFGTVALYSIIGYRWKKDLGGISKWRGWCIPDKDFKCWILPTFHPSYVTRSDMEVMTIWKQDLRKVFDLCDQSLPRYRKPKMEIIEDLSVLDTIKADQVAFDYETTGLKPHAKRHRIVCAAVADSAAHCYIFMMPKSKNARLPFYRLLEKGLIGKMAHNMKYEDTWTVEKLGVDIQGWDWDSMQAAHILDNRPGVTSLKFQTYVNFGVVDYASHITPYLQGVDKKDGNALNRILEFIDDPTCRKELLTYCGWDAIWEYRLAMKQIEEIGYDFMPF